MRRQRSITERALTAQRMTPGAGGGRSILPSPSPSPRLLPVVPPEIGRDLRLAVAAADSTDSDKRAAGNFVCDGTNDEDVINAAVQQVQAHSSYNNGGEVVCLAGQYHLSNPVEVGDDGLFPSLWLHGVGAATLFYGESSPASLIHQVGYLFMSVFSDMYLKNIGGDAIFDHTDSADGVEWVTWERLWIEVAADGIKCNVDVGGAFDFCAIRNNWFNVSGNAINLYRDPGGATGGVVECSISDNIIDGGNVVVDMSPADVNGWSLDFTNNTCAQDDVEIGGIDAVRVNGNLFAGNLTVHDIDGLPVAGNICLGTYTETSCTNVAKAGNVGIT